MCYVDGCLKSPEKRGLCDMHYMRLRRYGDVNIVKQHKGLSLSCRYERHVVRLDGCWDWSGTFNSDGYAKVFFDGRWVGAHRISWILSFGEIPNGLHVLHKCDNPRCTNPDHLFLGTNSDNVADKVSKGRQYRTYTSRICSIDGCGGVQRKLGMCNHHYNMQYKALKKSHHAT